VRPLSTPTQVIEDAAGGLSREQRQLFLTFLKQEIAVEPHDQPDLVSAAEQSLLDLGAYLVGLVGTEGFQALLQSALNLAAAEFPPLSAVEARAWPAGRVIRLRRSVRRLQPAEADEALALIVGNLIWLLTRLVGRDVTLHLLSDLWPRISDALDELE
jgi:hypothetical protein